VEKKRNQSRIVERENETENSHRGENAEDDLLSLSLINLTG